MGKREREGEMTERERKKKRTKKKRNVKSFFAPPRLLLLYI